MILFKKTADLRKWLDDQSKKGNLTGFVPTMGALHEGHISLIEASHNENSATVCSIFVNPTQFNDPKDFKKYPVTIETDIAMLEAAGCTALFLPSVEEVYPGGLIAARHYNLGYQETILEGKFRPGHFQGVCQVVHRLLEIVQPSHLYLGQKDYQQCMVITKLTELINKDSTIKIRICPTLREEDGLAMSSRNRRLNKEERRTATAIYQSLRLVKENLHPDNLLSLQQEAQHMLRKAGFTIDYVEIADAEDLSPVVNWDGKKKLVGLVAAFLNEVRLIDNMLLN
ncbi:MAG: pantoate--beta-alanine ligase [Chitinophagaceae bacterium]